MMAHPPTTANRCQSGFALVLVLWILSLLMIMAGSFALSMRREAAIIADLKNTAKAAALAESGIAIAEMMLLNTDPAKRWRTDGSIYQINADGGLSDGGGQIRLRLLAENGKIDINKAEQPILESLFQHSPLADDEKQQSHLIGAIIDWRDADDLVHIDGAEKKDYQDAGLKYQPRNKPFQSVEELRLVLGMDDTTFAWLAPLITVYSGQPQINAQLATKEVLYLLPNADTGLIDDYIANRRDSIVKELPLPVPPLTAVKNAPFADNDVVSIVSEALMSDDSRAIVSAVIKKADVQKKPFAVLQWQRAMTTHQSLFDETLGATATDELIVRDYAESEFNR
jgi:general secretion pathway protein K